MADVVGDIELLHHVLDAEMDVDRVVENQLLGARPVHLPDDAAASSGHIHDDDVVGGSRAERKLLAGVAVGGPIPAPARKADDALFLQESERLGREFRALGPAFAEAGALGEGQLECRAFHVIDENEGVVQVDAGLFGRLGEKVFRMAGEILIQRRGGRHEDRHRGGAAPPRPARLLPEGSSAPRIAGHDRGVQAADVYAQLQGVGRHDTVDRPLAQAFFNGAPLRGQEPRPVGAHRDPPVLVVGIREALGHVARDELDLEPRSREEDRLHAHAEQFERDALGFRGARAAQPLHRIDDGRIIEDHRLAARPGAAPVHKDDRLLHERLGELPGIGDRRRAEDEGRVRAVEGGDALQPPNHVADVAAEYAAVAVHLVDHDVFEARKEGYPLGVVRQDAGVEHVRIADDDASRGARHGAQRGWRIAVVGLDLHRQAAAQGDLVQLGLLVLGKGLGREQIERPRGGIIEERLDHGEVVAERLARRRRRDDHDIAAPAYQAVALGLVGVQ